MVTPRVGRELERVMQGVLPRQGSVVLAVSGGLDSMVLLDVAARVGRRTRGAITVATFDHASGPHSARAISLVARTALMHGLPVVSGRARAGEHSEAAWRSARWSFLRSVARQLRAVVLTAHTRDDQIETVLMRAMRGAGARGLAGLYAPSAIRRPFLDVTRAKLHAYAIAKGVRWLEDPTNRSLRYLRNRIRHDLLPALRRARPSLDEELLEIARRSAVWRREIAALVDKAIEYSVKEDDRHRTLLDVPVGDLIDYSPPMLAIVWPELASRAGVTLDGRGTARATEFTISSHTGNRIQLSGGWELVRSRRNFELRPVSPRSQLQHETRFLQPPMTWDRWRFALCETASRRDAWTAELPATAMLCVRAWKPGDRLVVEHGGRLIARKVKYFLSDAGISGHIRSSWPVVVVGDEVVWIPGVRRSDAATVRSGRPLVTYACDYLDQRS